MPTINNYRRFSKRNFQSCVCPICREYFEAKKFCQSARSTLHRCCARCPTTEGCVQTTVGTASATRRATSNSQANDEQRAAIDRFNEATEVYEPHRKLYKHQDEQYRLMKDTLAADHAMLVADFSPYGATALQLTQDESRQAVTQVLHVVVIRRSSKERSTTTTGTSIAIRHQYFVQILICIAAGTDLKFYYFDLVVQFGSMNDYAFMKTALVVNFTLLKRLFFKKKKQSA